MSDDDPVVTASPDLAAGKAKIKRRLGERTIVFACVVLMLLLLVPLFMLSISWAVRDDSPASRLALFAFLGGLLWILGTYSNTSRHFSLRIYELAHDGKSSDRLRRDFPWGFSSLAATAFALITMQAVFVNSAYVAPRPPHIGQVWLAASDVQVGWNSDLDGIELVNVEEDMDRQIASLRSPAMLNKILASCPVLAKYCGDADDLTKWIHTSRFENTNRYLVSMEMSDNATARATFPQLIEQFIEELKHDEIAQYTELDQEIEKAHSVHALRLRGLREEVIQYRRRYADELSAKDSVFKDDLYLAEHQVRLNEETLDRYTTRLFVKDSIRPGMIPPFRVDGPYEFFEKESQPQFLVCGGIAFLIPFLAFAFAWGVERWHVRHLLRAR